MFEPKIIAYLCTWCSYTGADTAGIARLKSPASLRAIRVPCSGRVSPELIMRTFDQGADGVLVLACHIGECHYDSGNHRTSKRIPIVQALMDIAGLERERLRLDYVSASEGERFSRIANEFVETIKALGPANWEPVSLPDIEYQLPSLDFYYSPANQEDDGWHKEQDSLHTLADELLSTNTVSCIIGYENSPREIVRPVFVYQKEQVDRLVWNDQCTHNLSTYLPNMVEKRAKLKANGSSPAPIAIMVKPCDSKAINVLLAEKQLDRDDVFLIGLACQGIKDESDNLQVRCLECDQRIPVVYDSLIGEQPEAVIESPYIQDGYLGYLDELSTQQRMEFWLSQFDRCIRCYACRQACPMCYCPTCLFERDDSLWVGAAAGRDGVGLSEKRTFHLGRALHLAGRCVGCNECERVCPIDIPISLLNRKLAQEIQHSLGFKAGQSPVLSPVLSTIPSLSQEDIK
jgi:coenzyme F420-reducing hydrogenase delta subunit/ferredoxin